MEFSFFQVIISGPFSTMEIQKINEKKDIWGNRCITATQYLHIIYENLNTSKRLPIEMTPKCIQNYKSQPPTNWQNKKRERQFGWLSEIANSFQDNHAWITILFHITCQKKIVVHFTKKTSWSVWSHVHRNFSKYFGGSK